MKISDRLLTLRKTLGYTQEKFSKFLGISRANYSQYEGGRSNANPNLLQSIAKQFNTNLHWLITGEGEMFLSKDQDKKPKLEINSDKLHHYIELGKAQARQEISHSDEVLPAYLSLPIVGEIAAGTPMQVSEHDGLGTILVSAQVIHHINNYYCFRVNGCSMRPEVHHLDVVIINKVYNWEDLDDKIVAVRIDEGITLKVLKLDDENKCTWLMPVNNGYKPILLNENSTIVVLGVLEYLIRSYK
ncbi:helix-turn-helix domain-containing protein [bacterium]|nr:helix-turn-helix domain-containing protein [bacterium]